MRASGRWTGGPGLRVGLEHGHTWLAAIVPCATPLLVLLKLEHSSFSGGLLGIRGYSFGLEAELINNHLLVDFTQESSLPSAYNTMGSVMYDYIVVGGGLSGCVVASRLSQYDKDASILLIEAGPDTRSRTEMLKMEAINLGGPFDWQYKTEPVASLSGRSVVYNSGKGLGGGTLINSGKPPCTPLMAEYARG